ncbi:MAG TPA: acyltransferase, partial [Ramlibacter sp.]|nr:acyltransferase [Ramlibacter sp.]
AGAFALSVLLYHQLPPAWLRLGGLALFVDNIIAGFHWYSPISYTEHLWTISLEEQFYLVLPLLLGGWLVARTRLLRSLAICWLLFVGFRIAAVLSQASHPLIWTSVFSADSLLLGTLFGALRPIPPSSVFVRLMIVAGGAVALFSGALLPPLAHAGAHQVIVYSFIAVGAAALTSAALHERWLAFLTARPLRYLGKISYGLYVFHLLGIALAKLAPWPVSTSWWVEALTAFAATLALSVVSYELFERQFLKLKQRFETVRSRPV